MGRLLYLGQASTALPRVREPKLPSYGPAVLGAVRRALLVTMPDMGLNRSLIVSPGGTWSCATPPLCWASLLTPPQIK